MNFVPLKSISQLQPGTIIRHMLGKDALVVTANYGETAIAVRTRETAIAVRTQSITNPNEWMIADRRGLLGGPTR